MKFYYERLPKVRILSANMFTKRFIGFGGVMTAVPMLKPLWEWVKEAQEPAEVLP